MLNIKKLLGCFATFATSKISLWCSKGTKQLSILLEEYLVANREVSRSQQHAHWWYINCWGCPLWTLIFLVQCRSKDSLSRLAQRDVCHLLLTITDMHHKITIRSLIGSSLANNIEEQNEAFVTPNGSKSMNTRFFLPTPDICERLFSSSGFALKDTCEGLCPPALEYNCFCTSIASSGAYPMSPR